MYLCNLFVLWFMYYTCFAREDNVLEFDDSDFENRIAEHEMALVMFYAPWCIHCQFLKLHYDEAAEDLIKNKPPIALVKVDCTGAGKQTCKKYEVDGYPTLNIFRGGKFSHQYTGARQVSSIVKYMQAQVGPCSKELNSVADLEQFLATENTVSVVGFFETDSDLKAEFLKTADDLRGEMGFAHSSQEDVLQKHDGIVLFRPVHLHNKFENNSVTYSGRAESGEIKDFVTNNYHGLVGHRIQANKGDFKNPLVVAYYDVDYEMNPKGTNYWRNRILKVAKRYKDKINFAFSAMDQFTQELEEFGIDDVADDKPIVLARNSKSQKFFLKEPFSVESLDQFVQNLLDDKLEPFVRSEPIPESNDGPVKVAVAKNFDDVVVNNKKDTLIEFYGPGCDDCKKLEPVYDELAEKLKDEDVAFVKMDASVNDVPSQYDVRDYPVFYWAGRYSKKYPRRYEGGHEVDDFIKYIAIFATAELEGYDRDGNAKVKKTEL